MGAVHFLSRLWLEWMASGGIRRAERDLGLAVCSVGAGSWTRMERVGSPGMGSGHDRSESTASSLVISA